MSKGSRQRKAQAPIKQSEWDRLFNAKGTSTTQATRMEKAKGMGNNH